MKLYNKFKLTAILLIISTGLLFASEKIKLVILHTNDTHSQVEPTEKSSSKTSDMGGYARRIGVIDSIRHKEQNVLLVDAGDFSQGTPYFNFFNGRVEIDAFNRMKYDAVTLGNHEFDNGVDTLAVILKRAKLPIISSNYLLENTSLKGLTKPYLTIEHQGLRIGIMAINVQPKGLIIENNYKGVVYENALEKAIEVSSFLKKAKKCDVIICLSHLGADTTKMAVNDYEIAHKTSFIDIIIGGHSHTLLENVKEKNKLGKPVIIAQMGKSGLFLGKVELELQKK